MSEAPTKKYRVWGRVVGSKYLGEFEAETSEKALEMALDSDAASPSLCYHCSGECEDPVVEDGVAEEIEDGQ